jgi:hypothetical protein
MMSRSFLASLLVLLSPVLIAAIPIALAWASYVQKVETYKLSEETYVRLAQIAKVAVPVTSSDDVNTLLADVSLGNDTSAILGAGLQSKLREIAQQNGLEVIQAADMETAPTPEGDSAPQRIGIRIDVSGPTKGVHSFLTSIEVMKPWLFVDNVRLQAGSIEGAEATIEPPMQLSLDVWGLRLASVKP